MLRRKTLIIAAIAAVLLAGGIAALIFWPDAPPPEGESAENGRSPGDLEAIWEDLLTFDREEIARINFYPSESYDFSIVFDGEDFELYSPHAMFSGDEQQMNFLINSAISVRSLALVEREADDEMLEAFGFNEPYYIWSVETLEGEVTAVEVGGLLIDGGRYIREAGSRVVLVLTEWLAGLTLKDIESLYDLSFLPLPPSDSENFSHLFISHVLIERDGETYEIHKLPESEISPTELVPAHFRAVWPESFIPSNDAIRDFVFSPLTHFIADEIVEKYPDDLSQYGLDAPIRVSARLDDDWFGRVLIGNRDLEHGGRFIMLEGYDAVLRYRHPEVPFLNVSLSQLRSSIHWAYMIDEVDSVAFELDGDNRVMRLQHGENNALTATLNGTAMQETNARRLFMATLALTHDAGELLERIIPQTEPEFRITIELQSGERDVIELYRDTDTRFLIVQNGQTEGLFMTRMNLQNTLLSRFDILDRGETLPLVA